MSTVEFFGYKLSNYSLAELDEQLIALNKYNKLNHIVTMNPTIFIQSEMHSQYKKLIQFSDLIVVDGVGVKWAVKCLKNISVNIITGIDLCYYLFKKKAISCYLLGGTQDVIEGTVNNIKMSFPETSILGYHHGYFSTNTLQKIISEIKTLKPQYIFVATGFPYQEVIIKLLKENGCHGIAIGVGGAFDVISGKKKLAPKLIRHLNFEWLYRSLQDVKKILKLRYLAYFSIFIGTKYVLKWFIRIKKFLC